MELEKDPQEYEHIEDIPEPVMSSVVDGSYEAPQTPSPKAPRADIEQIPTELEDLAAEEPLVEGESPKPEITKDPEEAPKESLKQAPQEQETPKRAHPQ
ncbi:hypothetical protein NHP21005_02440 [Helicobacter sp. NHP21005]|uniref:hypothetical protein n=1 Tax=Helicobacter felistomachi TaxID=3040201 RepID=UPI0025734711|nr:hypothetical protein [Helicobacter sp. NHP21005]BEG56556.1 hypothetical protein NHP21005_02440 [Helicobacter sp. NHP21005]